MTISKSACSLIANFTSVIERNKCSSLTFCFFLIFTYQVDTIEHKSCYEIIPLSTLPGEYRHRDLYSQDHFRHRHNVIQNQVCRELSGIKQTSKTSTSDGSVAFWWDTHILSWWPKTDKCQSCFFLDLIVLVAWCAKTLHGQEHSGEEFYCAKCSQTPWLCLDWPLCAGSSRPRLWTAPGVTQSPGRCASASWGAARWDRGEGRGGVIINPVHIS